jgi:hypothetical protein
VAEYHDQGDQVRSQPGWVMKKKKEPLLGFECGPGGTGRGRYKVLKGGCGKGWDETAREVEEGSALGTHS